MLLFLEISLDLRARPPNCFFGIKVFLLDETFNVFLCLTIGEVGIDMPLIAFDPFSVFADVDSERVTFVVFWQNVNVLGRSLLFSSLDEDGLKSPYINFSSKRSN